MSGAEGKEEVVHRDRFQARLSAAFYKSPARRKKFRIAPFLKEESEKVPELKENP